MKTILKLNEEKLREKVKEIITEILFNTLPKHNICGNVYTELLESKPYILNEGLIQTYPIDNVVFAIKELFNLYEGEDELERNKLLYYLERNKNYNEYNGIISKYSSFNQTKRIEIKVNKYDFNQNDFDKYFLKYGWYCGFSSILEGYDNIIRFVYEKKFDIDVTEVVKEKKFIYHICPNIYLNKINRVGLKPKYSSWNRFTNPERVYFFLNEISHEDFYKWAYNFKWEKKIKNNEGWSLLKIDISKLTNNPTFYFDPRMKNGVYTIDTITPESIEIIDFIKESELIV